MFRWKSRRSLPLWLTFLGAATLGIVQAPLAYTAATESNTTITSQRMTVHNQDNKAIFEGTVVLTKGSLVVHSDVMIVFFKPSDQSASSESSDGSMPGGSKNGGRVEKNRSKTDDLPTLSNRSVSLIEATGRVKITKDQGQATCRKAVYHGDEEKIVLTGDPVAWQKGTRVTGQKITMYLAEDRSVVEGGTQVMIQPEGGNTH
jgi:lipopolysaccharide export system protein LptA